ncbi:Pseudouridylate synthases%2C 23S RNA-specific [Streptococcus pneumoniae]|nr:Pseudouridylate synthases%2C 23S RNA-specific [Streptococcus pneumoniae]
MDIYIKKAIIHQFSPDDTELFLADKFLNITPKIEEYLRKKIEHVYSDEAKTRKSLLQSYYRRFVGDISNAG